MYCKVHRSVSEDPRPVILHAYTNSVQQHVTWGLHQRKRAMPQSLFSFPPSCPPSSLHPDQLIDTFTARHYTDKPPVLSPMKRRLLLRASLLSVLAHLCTRTHRDEEKGQLLRREWTRWRDAQQRYSSSSILDSVVTHPKLWKEPRWHFAHSADDCRLYRGDKQEDREKINRRYEEHFQVCSLKISPVFSLQAVVCSFPHYEMAAQFTQSIIYLPHPTTCMWAESINWTNNLNNAESSSCSSAVWPKRVNVMALTAHPCPVCKEPIMKYIFQHLVGNLHNVAVVQYWPLLAAADIRRQPSGYFPWWSAQRFPKT